LYRVKKRSWFQKISLAVIYED
jgi:hypothetical protein